MLPVSFRHAGVRLTNDEAETLLILQPDLLAFESQELFGSGTAVSKARLWVIRSTDAATKRAGYNEIVPCGVRIVEGEDARRVVELGAEGTIVSSSVAGLKDWAVKTEESALPMAVRESGSIVSQTGLVTVSRPALVL